MTVRLSLQSATLSPVQRQDQALVSAPRQLPLTTMSSAQLVAGTDCGFTEHPMSLRKTIPFRTQPKRRSSLVNTTISTKDGMSQHQQHLVFISPTTKFQTTRVSVTLKCTTGTSNALQFTCSCLLQHCMITQLRTTVGTE